MGDPEARPGHAQSIVTEWSVDPDDYGYFLCRVFDEWLKKDVGKVLVNHFETLVVQHMGMPSQICIYSEACGKGVASNTTAAFIHVITMSIRSIVWATSRAASSTTWFFPARR